jgi:hypothetical protein
MNRYQKRSLEIDTYGDEAAVWLKLWDEGQVIWSISVGGDYYDKDPQCVKETSDYAQQCVQTTAAEIMRVILENKYDLEKWEYDAGVWVHDMKEIRENVLSNEMIVALNMRPMLWGNALFLASSLIYRGPRVFLKSKRAKKNLIQVQKMVSTVSKRKRPRTETFRGVILGQEGSVIYF